MPTSQGIATACAWNRSLIADETEGRTEERLLSDETKKRKRKRLVPIYRMAPRRRDLGILDFDGHYDRPFSRARPSLAEWLEQGRVDAGSEALFWNGTFEPHPTG